SVWSMIIVTGAIGNGLVLYILFRFGERSVTNVYVINLAFADLMFIIFVETLPCFRLKALELYVSRPLLFMSFEQRRILPGFITRNALSCFLMAFSIFPRSMGSQEYRKQGQGEWKARRMKRSMGSLEVLEVVMTTFFIPMTAITICYGCILQHLWKGNKMKRAKPENEAALPIKNDKQERQLRRKKRVTRMVAIVVFLFALCWFPIHLIALWIQFDPNFPRTDAMHYFKLFGHTLSYANSCVNPFVYAFVNEGFKQAIIKRSPLITKLCQCVLEEKQKKNNKNMIDKSVGTRPTIEGQKELQTVQNNV
ncbi:Hypothetical predicted protein, partial [Mytilus galloprovincialis]